MNAGCNIILMFLIITMFDIYLVFECILVSCQTVGRWEIRHIVFNIIFVSAILIYGKSGENEIA